MILKTGIELAFQGATKAGKTIKTTVSEIKPVSRINNAIKNINGVDNFIKAPIDDTALSKYMNIKKDNKILAFLAKLGEPIFQKFVKNENDIIIKLQKSVVSNDKSIQQTAAKSLTKYGIDPATITKESIEQYEKIQGEILRDFGVEVNSACDVDFIENLQKVLIFCKKKGYSIPKKITGFIADSKVMKKGDGFVLDSKKEICIRIPKNGTKKQRFGILTYNYMHETGHILHSKLISKADYLRLKNAEFSPETKALIAKDSGFTTDGARKYAQKNPLEFVAEYFDNRHYQSKLGTKFSPELDELYKLLKGPEVKPY